MSSISLEGQQSVERDRPTKRVVMATVAGNALEFYDFTTYAFFAMYIGRTFFPATDPLISLLLSVAVFGVGFVTRPIGGVLIGAFADRMGRKPAMLLTITLVTVGTLGLALTPSYASIGVAAPIIVVVCRLIQGLALGGEVGPSTSFLIEIAPEGQRGLYGSWQLASQGISSLVAGIIGIALTVSLPAEDMQAWGWRMPFLLALLLIPIAIYLRRSMPETLTEGDASQNAVVERPSLKRYAGVIAIATLVMSGTTVSTYVAIYMTTYATMTLKLSPTIGMVSTIVFGITTMLGSLAGGWLSDRYGRKKVMLIPRLLILLLAYPAFAFLVKHTGVPALLATTMLLAGLTAISGAPSLIAVPESFPRLLRATGMSIAYALGVTVFGGTTQAIITWLLKATNDPASPAWYVTATSVVTLLAIMALRETGGGKTLRD